MAFAGASSALLADVQERSDSPFGTLFLSVTVVQDIAYLPLNGKNSTSSNEETSMDGRSKLDPVYDDDDDEDYTEQEFLCSEVDAGTLADLLV